MSSEYEQNLGKGQPEYGVRMNLSIKFNDEMTRANREHLHNVVFENEDEYVRFTHHVWTQIDENGLELPDFPIDLTIGAPRWILEETRAAFSMRLVTEDDVRWAVGEILKQGKPQTAEEVKNFRVPRIIFEK